MTRRMRVPAGALLVLAAALATAVPASAAVSVRGTVVHRNARTHSFVVAAAQGHLTKVRSRHTVRLGRTVRVAGHRLRDGSIAATRIHAGAAHRRARLRGTVTFANRRAGRFTVSSAAGSISVRAQRSGVRAADDGLPAVGRQVMVTITVAPGGVVEEDDVNELGMDEGEVELEGVVQAVDPGAHTVAITASDDGAGGGTVTVGFPATFDVSGIAVGNEIEVKAVRRADGTFVLSRLDTENEDDLADEADSETGPQGEDNGDNGGRGGDD